MTSCTTRGGINQKKSTKFWGSNFMPLVTKKGPNFVVALRTTQTSCFSYYMQSQGGGSRKKIKGVWGLSRNKNVRGSKMSTTPLPKVFMNPIRIICKNPYIKRTHLCAPQAFYNFHPHMTFNQQLLLPCNRLIKVSTVQLYLLRPSKHFNNM